MNQNTPTTIGAKHSKKFQLMFKKRKTFFPPSLQVHYVHSRVINSQYTRGSEIITIQVHSIFVKPRILSKLSNYSQRSHTIYQYGLIRPPPPPRGPPGPPLVPIGYVIATLR